MDVFPQQDEQKCPKRLSCSFKWTSTSWELQENVLPPQLKKRKDIWCLDSHFKPQCLEVWQRGLQHLHVDFLVQVLRALLICCLKRCTCVKNRLWLDKNSIGCGRNAGVLLRFYFHTFPLKLTVPRSFLETSCHSIQCIFHRKALFMASSRGSCVILCLQTAE